MQGELPFKSSGSADLARLVTSGRHRPMTGVSSKCKNLVAQMLTVQPTDRISLDSIRRHPWTEGFSPDEDVGSSDAVLKEDPEESSTPELSDDSMQRSLHLVLPDSLSSASDDDGSKSHGDGLVQTLLQAGHSCPLAGCTL